MKKKSTKPIAEVGLLANGSAGRWHIEVDETLDCNEWFLEIEGPQIYLGFQVQELTVLPAALCFLQSGATSVKDRNGQPRHTEKSGFTLGRFGSMSVSLVWDNEDFPRCFLVVGPKATATLRLSLEGEDMGMFIEALRQVVEDLPKDFRK